MGEHLTSGAGSKASKSALCYPSAGGQGRQQKPHHVFPQALENPDFACKWALVLWFFVYLVFLGFLEGICFNLVLKFVLCFPLTDW